MSKNVFKKNLFIQAIENLILIEKSKPRFQKFYEDLFRISLVGMNIGTGGSILSDGELNALRYIKRTCVSNKNTVIFDVGANVGIYSREIIKEFRNINFQLHSFEPSKETFSELKKHLKNIPNTNLYNVGFGDKNARKTLFYDKKKSRLASMYNRRLLHFGIKMKLKESIKIYTIDDFCKKNSINKIDFLKLDTEGHELSILNGAKKMIHDKVIRFIQFEFGGCNIDSRTYFQDFWYLLSPQYRIYRILKNGMAEISKYKEIYELFLTTNFLAELK